MSVHQRPSCHGKEPVAPRTKSASMLGREDVEHAARPAARRAGSKTRLDDVEGDAGHGDDVREAAAAEEPAERCGESPHARIAPTAHQTLRGVGIGEAAARRDRGSIRRSYETSSGGCDSTRYRSSSQSPRSMSRHVSPQNGRFGLSCHVTGARQVGQRTPRGRGVRSFALEAGMSRSPARRVDRHPGHRTGGRQSGQLGHCHVMPGAWR